MSDSLQTEKILGQIDVSIEKYVNGKIRKVDGKVETFHTEFVKGHDELIERLGNQDRAIQANIAATKEIIELFNGAGTFFRVSARGAKYISIIGGAVGICIVFIKFILHK